VQAIFWDVTEQREAEEKRREAEQRWRSLVEQSPDSIVVHSGGEIRLANPAAMTLFGIESMEELSGRHITEFIEPSFHEAVASRLDRLIKGEAVEQGAGMKVLKKNRETVDVEVYASAGPGKNEVQVVIHDLTGKQVLLKEMHHRVRRSLNNIQGLLSYHEGFTNDSRVTRAFEAVRRQIQAMALVHTILKDTARESDVQMRNYLTELVGAVAAAYLSPTTAVEHVIDVKDDFTLDEKRATACGLIVTELVSNSLLHGFREESGRVSVAMQKRGNRITLTVSDNGIGISSARKKNHDSMGLTLVAALVEDDLNGVPKVSGKNGTRWLITFPSVV
jgi:PAS domain S-box-containing protein